MGGIVNGGLITADVDIGGGPTVTISLLVDTGAEHSAIPALSLPPSALTSLVSVVGSMVVGGVTLTLVRYNTSAETDVEPHGRGAPSRAHSPAINVHSRPIGQAPFFGFDGILGMDLLDAFGVNPAKDAAASAAYLALRV